MLILFHLALPPRKNSPASPNKPPKPTSTPSHQRGNSPAPRHDNSQAPPVTPRRVLPQEPAHLKQESPEEFFGSKFKPRPAPVLKTTVHQCVISYTQGRRNRGGTGGPCPPPPPNNLHKYAVLLITKVCHFKKNYVCPPNL